ncbi:MAG: 50S ribosome-binding GTPase [Acidimicrobiia bacterium]|nr:50S ribosome-binding GTPase [Acidimicrobiia bacterium]
MADLTPLLDTLDMVTVRGAGVVDPVLVDTATDAARSLRLQRGYLGDQLVVALAGGTGSGKSSLLNALAGMPVASVSRVRPHTDEPLALVSPTAGSGIDSLLGSLGISRKVAHSSFDHLVILDLPDVDSIAEWHRRIVEELMPRIDVVIWVFDPEKYQDPLLHDGFLGPLAAWGSQMIFILNQIDRLEDDETRLVATDLAGYLAADGYEHPAIFLTAAAPTTGEPIGVQALADYLDTRLDEKRVVLTKTLAEVGRITRDLASAANVWTGGSVDFEDRWARVKQATAAALATGPDPAEIEDALCRVEDFVAAIGVEVGDDFGDRVRSEFPLARIETDVVAVAKAAASAAQPEGRGRKKAKARVGVGEAVAADELEERIGSPLRDLLRARAEFGAWVAQSGVVSAQLKERLQ